MWSYLVVCIPKIIEHTEIYLKLYLFNWTSKASSDRLSDDHPVRSEWSEIPWAHPANKRRKQRNVTPFTILPWFLPPSFALWSRGRSRTGQRRAESRSQRQRRFVPLARPIDREERKMGGRQRRKFALSLSSSRPRNATLPESGESPGWRRLVQLLATFFAVENSNLFHVLWTRLFTENREWQNIVALNKVRFAWTIFRAVPFGTLSQRHSLLKSIF